MRLLVLDQNGVPALSYGDTTGKTREQVEADARKEFKFINNEEYTFYWNEEADSVWDKIQMDLEKGE